ncbi:MAG TPA: translation elongation factor Ts [Phycisphaerae bacterium]|nr:translation elongation factor Ts [Phycisphaerae bacterium]
MAEITAKMVNDLRARTNAPMMDCKRALVDANGDPEKAAELLRERGSASADKKLTNEMKEGLVAGKISADGKTGALIRLGCQTDFVARNDGFQKLLSDLVDLAFNSNVNTPAEFNALKYPDNSGRTVETVIKEQIATIKENIGITGVAHYQASTGRVEKYVHHNGKVGALIQVDGSSDDAVKVVAGEIAMHIAAGVPQVPVAIDRSGVDPAVIEREKAAASEGTEGKPPQIVEKIVAGKLEKYFQDVTLVDQPFIKEEKKRIRDLLAETGKAVGGTVKIAKFARFKVGEA